MEFIKKIIDLITSFLHFKTQEKKEDVKLAEVTETAVVEEIRANQNAVAVEQQANVQEALDDLHKKHEEERNEAKNNSNADDEQFGSDW